MSNLLRYPQAYQQTKIIQDILDYFGSLSQLAHQLNISMPSASRAFREGRISLHMATEIERYSAGKFKAIDILNGEYSVPELIPSTTRPNCLNNAFDCPFNKCPNFTDGQCCHAVLGATKDEWGEP